MMAARAPVDVFVPELLYKFICYKYKRPALNASVVVTPTLAGVTVIMVTGWH